MTLVFETEGGMESPEFRYRNAITRGLPSLPVNIYIRNTLTDRTWEGHIMVSSSGSQTYPDDVYISSPVYSPSNVEIESSEIEWAKSFPVSIPPEERVMFRSRVLPRSTPENSSGSASIITYGEWIT